MLRVKSAVFAGAGAAVALVFFPVWFAVPVAVLLAAWGLGMAVRAATVTVDSEAGVLVLRMGLITRRVALADIIAVLVDASKLSIARAAGGEISLYAWRKSPLDRWLGMPAVAGDIGHAVAGAVALAKDARSMAHAKDARAGAGDPEREREREPADQPARSGTSARSRSALATALLGGTGLLALASAFLVRLAWPNPVLSVLSVLLALALGVAGLFYLMFALWLMLPRPAARTAD